MKKLTGIVILFFPTLIFGLSFFGLKTGYNTISPRNNGYFRLSYESLQQTVVGDIQIFLNADLPFLNQQPSGDYDALAHFDILSWFDVHPVLNPVLSVQAVTSDASLAPSLNLGVGVIFKSEEESGMQYASLDGAFLYHNPITNGFSANLLAQSTFKLATILLFNWDLKSHLSMYNDRLEWTSVTKLLYDLGSIAKANPMNLDLSDEATLIGIEGIFDLSKTGETMSYNGGGNLILGWKF